MNTDDTVDGLEEIPCRDPEAELQSRSQGVIARLRTLVSKKQIPKILEISLVALAGAVATYIFTVHIPDSRAVKSITFSLDHAEELAEEGKLQAAIEKCESALEQISREKNPLLYGRANKQKAALYLAAWLEERSPTHLERALISAERAQEAFAEDEVVAQRSESLYYRGSAEFYLSDLRDSKDSLQKAIRYLSEALALLRFQEENDRECLIRSRLAESYRKMSRIEDAGPMIQSALKEAVAARELITHDMNPIIAGEALHILAKINTDLLAYEGKEEFRTSAESALHEALRFFSLDRFPDERSRVEYSLGSLYFEIFEREKTKEPLERALEYFLTSRDTAATTQDLTSRELRVAWAEQGAGYALVYLARFEDEAMEANLKLAVEYFGSAVGVFERHGRLLHRARTLTGKAMALSGLAIGDDRASFLMHSLSVYKEVGRTFDSSRYPRDFVITMASICSIHCKLANLLDDEREKHADLALQHCESAMVVLDRSDFPDLRPAVEENLKTAQQFSAG